MNIKELLKKFFYKLQEKINSLPLAGRFGAMFIFLLAILVIWYAIFQLPVAKKQKHLDRQLTNINKTIEATNLEVNDIIKKITGKTLAGKKEELDDSSKEVEKYLSVLKGEIIPPDQMAEVLKNVLVKEHGLHLTSFRIYPKQTLVAGTTNKNGNKSLLYEQDFMISFTGDYFSTLSYLQHLEQLPWRFFWNDISYGVSTYPQASVTIKLHTLGQE
jgi:MSHA biogenesis protein MshJ